MKIAVYARSTNENLSGEVKDLLVKLGRASELIIYEPLHAMLQAAGFSTGNASTFNGYGQLKKGADYLLSLGGDGTLLETIALVRNSGIPILGVNTGRLGFLASVSKEEVDRSLEALVQKKFVLDKRALLQMETPHSLFGEVNYALNEVTVMKKDSSSMVVIHAYVNGEFLNSYWADGLIVSTPTGSTAYSLSCGGPIVLPDSENFIVTPIAPHNLNVRPIVISDDKVLTLKVEGRSDNYLVSLDARSEVIDSSTELTVKKAPFYVNLVRFEGQNFFNTLRNKLMWGQDKRTGLK